MSVAKRFVIALIKHETNTCSPIATPLSAFGHGNGPYTASASACGRFIRWMPFSCDSP